MPGGEAMIVSGGLPRPPCDEAAGVLLLPGDSPDEGQQLPRDFSAHHVLRHPAPTQPSIASAHAFLCLPGDGRRAERARCGRGPGHGGPEPRRNPEDDTGVGAQSWQLLKPFHGREQEMPAPIRLRRFEREGKPLQIEDAQAPRGHGRPDIVAAQASEPLPVRARVAACRERPREATH